MKKSGRIQNREEAIAWFNALDKLEKWDYFHFHYKKN